MTDALVRLGVDSDRARRACVELAALARPLVGAVRRSMPWLLRKRVEVTTEAPRAVVAAELLASLAGPCHVIPLVVAGRYEGALVFDGLAVARAVDGVLAGGSGDLPTLSPSGLSPAQAALAARVGRGLAENLGAEAAPIGFRVAIAEGDATCEGLQLASTVCIGEGDTMGRITLLVPAAAVEPKEKPVAPAQGAPAFPPGALDAVHVEVVAELGRVPLPLRRLAELRVGDVLRLPLSVDGPARVYVGGREIFSGKPVTRGHQIAIDLERHEA